MPQNKIIVDTNVYLRLAQNIHPLLKIPFGKNNYCLYVLSDLTSEYNNNPRLKNSFPWFVNDEYIQNRDSKLHISKIEKIEINEAFKFIRDASVDIAPDVSRIDIKCLAYAYVLNIPVSTDDSGMIMLAKEFEIKTLKLLELLKIMLDSNYIDMNKIKSIASYLIYLSDLPKDFKRDYKFIFKEDPPNKA